MPGLVNLKFSWAAVVSGINVNFQQRSSIPMVQSHHDAPSSSPLPSLVSHLSWSLTGAPTDCSSSSKFATRRPSFVVHCVLAPTLREPTDSIRLRAKVIMNNVCNQMVDGYMYVNSSSSISMWRAKNRHTIHYTSWLHPLFSSHARHSGHVLGCVYVYV